MFFTTNTVSTGGYKKMNNQKNTRLRNRKKQWFILALAVIFIAFIWFFGKDMPANSDSAMNANDSSSSPTTETYADAEYYSFANEYTLEQHYEKHGIEMGFDSAEDYEAAANDVIHDENALHKTEAEDGDDIYYLEDENYIVFVSGYGNIRTFFEPDAGKKYYDKQ